MNLVLPFVVYTVVMVAVVFLCYRAYRYCRKHWCPYCKKFSAKPQYVREIPPGERGGAMSQRRLCYTRKFCRCGFVRLLTPYYIRVFTAKELEEGQKRANVLNA